MKAHGISEARSHHSVLRFVRAGLFLLLICAVTPIIVSRAQDGPELRNWFNDPFFQISNAIPNCPVPAGPFITFAEKQTQSHHRAERGTTCWLVGKCKLPNAYAYDQDIAENFKSAWSERSPFKNSTVWVTVQGRIIFMEGCVQDRKSLRDIEKFALSIPDVEQAVAFVYSDLSTRPPYKLLVSP
jgi:hypothetical protein